MRMHMKNTTLPINKDKVRCKNSQVIKKLNTTQYTGDIHDNTRQ